MSKKQIRRIKRIIIFGAIVWLIRSIFFLKKDVFWGVTNILQWLINTIEDNEPTDKMFEWNAMTDNIYKRALNGKKRETANINNISLEKIQFVTNGVNIEKKDLLNILYNSNQNVAAGIDFLCKDCKISPKDINDSYSKVINALKQNNTLTNANDNTLTRAKVDERVNSQFIIASTSQSSLQELNNASLWEDVFVNWVADDSDYDLQIDIQNIGDLLFESFIAPIETVFYKLPSNYKGSSSTNNNDTTDKEELLSLLQNVINPSWSTNSDIITNWWSQPNQTTQNNTTNNQTSTTNNTTNDTEITDPSLQNFVEKNTLSQKSTTQPAWIQWDICREPVSAWPTTTTEDQETIVDEETLEEYIADIQDQIDSYNNLYPEDQIIPNISNNPAFSGMTSGQTNQFINQYIEDLLDTQSTESCLKNCNSLPTAEKALCKIQCLCFTMSWRNDPDIRVKSMNEMLKLRFCTVPAKSVAIPKWKNIYSLDDILQRIQSNMEDVVNWWEMVKFQKTKEYLDNPIADFSFSKLISFQINLNMKPIFNNKSAMAKKDQEKTYIQKLEEASGKEQTQGIDNNKYLVVQDTIKNKIYKKYASSVDEYQQKYEKERLEYDNNSRQTKSTQTRDIPVVTEKKSEMLTIIADFLQQNFKFREQTEKELQNLNNIVYSLQSKL